MSPELLYPNNQKILQKVLRDPAFNVAKAARVMDVPLPVAKNAFTRLVFLGALNYQNGKYSITSLGQAAAFKHGSHSLAASGLDSHGVEMSLQDKIKNLGPDLDTAVKDLETALSAYTVDAVGPEHDSAGKVLQIGDIVAPDYTKPGWRLKNLKQGQVVDIVAGTVTIKWAGGSTGGGFKPSMLKIIKSGLPIPASGARLTPKVGDKVYLPVRGFAGSGGSVHGVVSAPGKVKITEFKGTLPSTDVKPGKIVPLTEAWIVVGDPNAPHEVAERERQSASEKRQQAAKDGEDAVASYAARHGFKKADKHVKPGQTVFDLQSAGKHGGDPNHISTSETKVVEVKPTYIVTNNKEGREGTFPLTYPLYIKGSVVQADEGGACPASGCVKQVGGKWRVISNKTGELWDAHYDTKEDAEEALEAYHVHGSIQASGDYVTIPLTPAQLSALHTYVLEDIHDEPESDMLRSALKDGKGKAFVLPAHVQIIHKLAARVSDGSNSADDDKDTRWAKALSDVSSKMYQAIKTLKASVVSAAVIPWDKAAEAEGDLTKAYLALHTLKYNMDQMEDIPTALLPFYKQIMKALTTIDKKETAQLAFMASKLANHYHLHGSIEDLASPDSVDADSSVNNPTALPWHLEEEATASIDKAYASLMKFRAAMDKVKDTDPVFEQLHHKLGEAAESLHTMEGWHLRDMIRKIKTAKVGASTVKAATTPDTPRAKKILSTYFRTMKQAEALLQKVPSTKEALDDAWKLSLTAEKQISGFEKQGLGEAVGLTQEQVGELMDACPKLRRAIEEERTWMASRNHNPAPSLKKEMSSWDKELDLARKLGQLR